MLTKELKETCDKYCSAMDEYARQCTIFAEHPSVATLTALENASRETSMLADKIEEHMRLYPNTVDHVQILYMARHKKESDIPTLNDSVAIHLDFGVRQFALTIAELRME